MMTNNKEIRTTSNAQSRGEQNVTHDRLIIADLSNALTEIGNICGMEGKFGVDYSYNDIVNTVRALLASLPAGAPVAATIEDTESEQLRQQLAALTAAVGPFTTVWKEWLRDNDASNVELFRDWLKSTQDAERLRREWEHLVLTASATSKDVTVSEASPKTDKRTKNMYTHKAFILLCRNEDDVHMAEGKLMLTGNSIQELREWLRNEKNLREVSLTPSDSPPPVIKWEIVNGGNKHIGRYRTEDSNRALVIGSVRKHVYPQSVYSVAEQGVEEAE